MCNDCPVFILCKGVKHCGLKDSVAVKAYTCVSRNKNKYIHALKKLKFVWSFNIRKCNYMHF